MDMKKFISIVNEECVQQAQPQAPQTPISMNVNMNAQGTDQIRELLKLLNPQAETQAQPEIIKIPDMTAGFTIDKSSLEDQQDEGQYDASTTPDEEYQDTNYMTKDMSGGMNRQKKMSKHSYKQGDNPMAMEKIKQELLAQYKKMKES